MMPQPVQRVIADPQQLDANTPITIAKTPAPRPQPHLGRGRRPADPPARGPEAEQQRQRRAGRSPTAQTSAVDDRAEQDETHRLLERLHPLARLGRNRTSCGLAPITRYGLAMPRPITVKTSVNERGRFVAAPRQAVARPGPLHGVASSVVTTPLTNAPAGPSCSASSLAFPLPTKAGNRNLPDAQKLRPIANTTQTIDDVELVRN